MVIAQKESRKVFLFAYFLWVFFIHIGGSQYFTLFDRELLPKLFNVGVMLVLCFYLLISYKINYSSFFDIFITIVFFIGFFHFKQGVSVYLFIILCRNIHFSSIVKVFLLASAAGGLFVLFTYLFNLYPESTLDLFRSDGTYRYLLGYRFPTFVPNYFFHIVLCWIFLRKERITLCELLFILLLNYPIYSFTDTRAVFLLVIAICFSTFFIKYVNVEYSTFFIGRLYKLLTTYGFILFAGIAIYFQYVYDLLIDWMANLNHTLSGRLELGHRGFELYGIKPFGSLVEFVTMLNVTKENKFFYIDSAYAHLLIVYGVIIFSLVIISYTRIGGRIVLKNEKYFGLVLIFLFVHSITDPQLMSPEFNPFLLCLGYYGLEKYRDNLFK
ncbi:hypothetical protein [Haemophilus sp. SZY H54]